MKENRALLLQVLSSWKMEKEKLEEKLLEKKVATKAMIRSLVALKTILNRYEMGNGFFTKKNNEFLCCSSPSTSSNG